MSKSIIIITTFPLPQFAMVHLAPFPPCVDALYCDVQIENIKRRNKAVGLILGDVTKSTVTK